MDVTTRCPACGSIFRGAQDQLKASDGWVRCERCAHVFDATIELPAPVPVSASPSTPVSEGATARVPSADIRLAGAPATAVTAARAARDTGGAGAGKAAPARAPAPPDVPEPHFVRQARRRAFWRLPGVRLALGLLTLLLSVLLVAQWVFHERDRLAATQPALEPWLERACAALACELAPLRRLDSIAIDSTALVRRFDSVYDVDVVLKNTAPMALAMPALELTLTRWDDSVLVRRVFLPEALPGAPRLLEAGGSTALRLRLSLALGEDPPMAGYRALVFYP